MAEHGFRTGMAVARFASGVLPAIHHVRSIHKGNGNVILDNGEQYRAHGLRGTKCGGDRWTHWTIEPWSDKHERALMRHKFRVKMDTMLRAEFITTKQMQAIIEILDAPAEQKRGEEQA